MEGASVQGIGSYVPQHDRLRLWSSRWHCKFFTDTLVLLLILTLSETYPFSFQQVDDPAPTVSRSGRTIDLLQSGPISLISHNAPSLATLMHRNIRFKKTTKRSKVSPSVAAATLAQAFKVFSIFLITPISSHTYIIFSEHIGRNGTSSITLFCTKLYFLAKLHQYPFYTQLTEPLFSITANWRIGKDQKHANIGCRCPQPSKAPPKRKGPKSTKTQPKRQKIAPSSPPRPTYPI